MKMKTIFMKTSKLITLLLLLTFFSCEKDPATEKKTPSGNSETGIQTLSFRLGYPGETKENEYLFIFENATKERIEIQNEQSQWTVKLQADKSYLVFAFAGLSINRAEQMAYEEVRDYSVDWLEMQMATREETHPLAFAAQKISADELSQLTGQNGVLPLEEIFTKISISYQEDRLVKELFEPKGTEVLIDNIKAQLFPFYKTNNTEYKTTTTVKFIENEGTYSIYIPKALAFDPLFNKGIKIKRTYNRNGSNIITTLTYEPTPSTEINDEYNLGVFIKYDYPYMKSYWYDKNKYPDGYKETKTFAFLDGEKTDRLHYNTDENYDVWIPGVWNPDGLSSGEANKRWAEDEQFAGRAIFSTYTYGVSETYWFWDEYDQRCGIRCSHCANERYGYPYTVETQDERRLWMQHYAGGWLNTPNYVCPLCGQKWSDSSDVNALYDGQPGDQCNGLTFTEGRSMVKVHIPRYKYMDGETCAVWFEDKKTGSRDTLWVPVGIPEDMAFVQENPHDFYVGQKIKVLWDDKTISVSESFTMGESVAKRSGGGGGGNISFNLLTEGTFQVEFKNDDTGKHLGYFAMKVKEPVIGDINNIVIE